MSTPPARPSVREEQKSLTRRRLLEAAEAVFAQRGFHGASVDQIAREAGATTGALYSHFASKEALFLELFDETVAADVRNYADVAGAGASVVDATRAAADRWIEVLHERPQYFPLFVEFWASALRDPELRGRFAERLVVLRAAAARIVADGAAAAGISVPRELAERLGLLITTLGNGVALEKLADPAAVPDDFYGEMLVLIFQGLGALASQLGEGDSGRGARRMVRTVHRQTAARATADGRARRS